MISRDSLNIYIYINIKYDKPWLSLYYIYMYEYDKPWLSCGMCIFFSRLLARWRWKSSSVWCVQAMSWELTAAEQSPTTSRACPASKCSTSSVRTAWSRHYSQCAGLPYDAWHFIFFSAVVGPCFFFLLIYTYINKYTNIKVW